MFLAQEEEEEELETTTATTSRVEEDPTPRSTGGFPRYDVETEVSLRRFQLFLQSTDGNRRSAKVAREFAVDVSKYLKFTTGEVAQFPDWSRLTDQELLNAYVNKLERVGLGPDGIVVKLDVLELALRHYRINILRDEDSAQYTRANKASEVLSHWRKQWRRDKSHLRAERMEVRSENAASLEDVTEILSSKAVWEFYSNTVDSILAGTPVTGADLNACTLLLASAVCINSM